MFIGNLVFAQIMEHLPLTTFRRFHPPRRRIHRDVKECHAVGERVVKNGFDDLRHEVGEGH